MRRLLLAIVVWVVLVGGLYEYMHRRNARPVERSAGVADVQAAGAYSLEVTPGFTPEPDPYHLTLDGRDAPALTVVYRGRELLRQTGGMEAGRPFRIDSLPGVSGGLNEIVITASPPVTDKPLRHFLQARVLHDGAPVASDIFWADGSARVDGVLRFSAPSSGRETADGK